MELPVQHLVQHLDAGDGQLHRAIVEQAQDAIIYADRSGLIRLWNRGAEIIFGHAAAEMIGQSLDSIIPPRLRQAHHDGFNKATGSGLARHEGRVITTRAQHKYGSRLYVDLSFGLLKDAAGNVTGAFAIGRDATERYLKEEAARQEHARSVAATPP